MQSYRITVHCQSNATNSIQWWRSKSCIIYDPSKNIVISVDDESSPFHLHSNPCACFDIKSSILCCMSAPLDGQNMSKSTESSCMNQIMWCQMNISIIWLMRDDSVLLDALWLFNGTKNREANVVSIYRHGFKCKWNSDEIFSVVDTKYLEYSEWHH